jgi:hypothetical protein
MMCVSYTNEVGEIRRNVAYCCSHSQMRPTAVFRNTAGDDRGHVEPTL